MQHFYKNEIKSASLILFVFSLYTIHNFSIHWLNQKRFYIIILRIHIPWAGKDIYLANEPIETEILHLYFGKEYTFLYF